MKSKSRACLLVLCLTFSVGLTQAQFGGGGCESVTYSGVTPDRFECMNQGLQEYGIYVPSGESGELSGNGIAADFEWDGESILTITVTEKPFFVGCGTIHDRIRQFAQEC
ncbi:hypothetical protein RG963_14240 [Methanosarcina sp. Z-7115]|uniref:Uncharacterized protein n=1 Tax=Methanosarcina baikalica TaxID=3073890 RepID=A0ABU2D4Q4_9EURY|nr:hypothetical protein [Methanosarcina sp. Z-7115]MDR7666917.1 hypothetical protein [Methanosarcina sp. Z-7115]